MRNLTWQSWLRKVFVTGGTTVASARLVCVTTVLNRWPGHTMAYSDCLHCGCNHGLQGITQNHIESKIYTNFTRLHSVISAAAVIGL
jgi:hypothetical protein